MKITELFVKAGLASSNKEAKRLINEGGARINDQVVEDPNLLVSHVEGHLIFGKWVGERFEVLHGLEPCSAEQSIAPHILMMAMATAGSAISTAAGRAGCRR